MSDISKMRVNGTEYDIKDSGGRALIDAEAAARAADVADLKDDLSQIEDDLGQISEVVGSGTIEAYDYEPVAFTKPVYVETIRGITFTPQNDGSILVIGTNSATSRAIYTLKDTSGNKIPIQLTAGKTYKLTGGLSNDLTVGLRRESGGNLYTDGGSGVLFTITETGSYYIAITTPLNVQLDSVIKPALFEQIVIHKTGDILSAKDEIARAYIVSNNQTLDDVKSYLSELGEDVEAIIPGLSDEAKEALLACFANVAWTNQNGRTYYDNLKEALGLSLLYSWDFTKSLTDTVQGLTATLDGRTTLPTRNNTGIIFDAASQAITLLSEEYTYTDFLVGKTVQIDIAEFDPQSTSVARTLRFLTMKDHIATETAVFKTGLCYYEEPTTNEPRWCLVTYVEGESISYVPDEVSFMSQKTDISGHTIGVYFDASGRIKVYRDGTLTGISNNAIPVAGQVGLQIGNTASESFGGRFYNARITGARIYDGDIA